MRLSRKILAAAAVVSSAAGIAAGSAGAANDPEPIANPTSTVTVIHGIPGADLGLDPELPVDVLVNGELCALTDFRFGDISPRLELPAGAYDLEVRVSDGACGGPVAVSAEDVEVPGGVNATVVANLTEEGDPTLSAFLNDLDPTERYQARVAVHHLADAPAVDVTATYNWLERWSNPFVSLSSVVNGDQGVADTWVGPYILDIYPAGGSEPVATAEATLIGGRYYGIYAVGSLESGTFRLIVDVQLTEGASH